MIIKIPTSKDFYSYSGLHCHKLWKEVGDHYICPACKRNKFEIMRWATRFPNTPVAFKDWVAVLHRHHDHSQGIMRLGRARFPDTVVCDQCNSSDGAIKRKLKLPKDFSFSPQELALIIRATPHGKHQIDYEIAKRIYMLLNIFAT